MLRRYRSSRRVRPSTCVASGPGERFRGWDRLGRRRDHLHLRKGCRHRTGLCRSPAPWASLRHWCRRRHWLRSRRRQGPARRRYLQNRPSPIKTVLKNHRRRTILPVNLRRRPKNYSWDRPASPRFLKRSTHLVSSFTTFSRVAVEAPPPPKRLAGGRILARTAPSLGT